jgi:NADH-quinone oxidoreductase subunit L
MPGSNLITLSLIILFLPLIGFITVLLFGKRFSKLYNFEIGILSANLLLTLYVAYEKLFVFANQKIQMDATWFSLGNISGIGQLNIDLGIEITNVTVLMLFVVNLISFLVHVYSTEYMHGDSRFSRYYSYLGIFTFSMLGIVLTDNFLMLYIFWELVGLSSYLLIGFWYEKDSAANAGKKAFLVNRVGDMGMWLGILILFTNYHTFKFDTIFAQIGLGHIPFGSEAWLTAAGILLFMGAVGKSAQFPLHVWLPDAMEGPTPVSALIHAATMVAAGVYMLTKIFVMLSADALMVIALVGAFTSFLAASIAITQNDIKKVLAYSTVSQLGYMVMAVGVGAYTFAFFHLVTHAFFKALLFLGSGSVIHAMHHEQDMRQMGGLRKKMPITYYTFLTATLAISGIPLFSGFLSKDGLLAGTYAFGLLTGHWTIAIFGFVVAFMTAFYMFRLVIMTFHGEPRNQKKYDHAHETPKAMTIPLITLAVLSIWIWYTPNPFNPEAGWFYNKMELHNTVVPQNMRFNFMKTEAPEHEAITANEAAESNEIEGQKSPEITETRVMHSEMYEHAMHQAHLPTMIWSILLAGLGILFAYVIYQWKKLSPEKMADMWPWLYKFSLNKWYVDEFYDKTFIGGTLEGSRWLSIFDNKVVDGIVNGAATFTRGTAIVSGWFDTYIVDGLVNFTAFFSGVLGFGFKKIQNGNVQNYVLVVILSLILLFIVFLPFF